MRKSTLSVVLATFTAASLTFIACNKDSDSDGDDKGTLTTEQKTDGNKAAAAAAGKVVGSIGNSGSGFTGLGAQIRSLYKQGKTQSRTLQMLQEDGVDETGAGADFDLCSFIAGDSCTAEMNQTPAADETGTTCTVSSCTGGRTETCTSPSETAACGAVTYTMSASTVTSTMSCTKVSEGKYTFDIAADFSGSISGGSLSSAAKLACKMKIALAFDLNATTAGDDKDVELSCEDGQFACTLDGEALSCDDLKAAMKDDTCG